MKAFFDTNVLVYALDPGDARKQAIAQETLHRHSRDRTVVLSTQVLMETFNILTRKKGVAPADALATVQLFATRTVVHNTSEATLRALALSVRHQLSPWDAAIVQAAQDAGCDVLLSEDLQAGQRLGTLEVVNPFAVHAHEATPGGAEPAAMRKRAPTRASARSRRSPKPR